MKEIRFNSVSEIFRNCYSSPVGEGNTAICYLTYEGYIFKLYKRTLYDYVPKSFNLKHQLEQVAYLKNDCAVTPDALILLKNKCIGYSYQYQKGTTLKDINDDVTLKEIIYYYEKIEKDIEDLSNKKFVLSDLHDENIIMVPQFKIIDLDFSFFSRLSNNMIYSQNMKNFGNALLCSLFEMDPDDKILFKDRKLNFEYICSHFDYKKIKKLLEDISNLGIDYKSQIKKNKLIKIKSKKHYKQVI